MSQTGVSAGRCGAEMALAQVPQRCNYNAALFN